MKFKLGDKVRINEDLNCDMRFVSHPMIRYAGKLAVVKKIPTQEYCRLDVDDGNWGWYEHMLEKAQFAKQDINPCMMVKLRCGIIRIAMNTRRDGIVFCDRDFTAQNSLQSYTNDFKEINGDAEYDIVEVYDIKEFDSDFTLEDRDLLYKEEPQEMTLEEICKELGKEIKIVKEKAR